MPSEKKILIKQLDLELNGGCNYKCPMCPQSSGREKDFLKKLPYDLFTKIVDDANQYGLEAVSLHGSGEPTLNADFDKYVKYVKKKQLRCVSFTNGLKLDEELSVKLIKAGIDVLRVSCIGYDRGTYNKWMSRDEFNLVRENIKRFVELNKELKGKSDVHLYHLIINKKALKKEIEMYRKNWINYTGAKAEIWLMHSWAGSDVKVNYTRDEISEEKVEKRSCGRPFSPLLQVRAGGINGHNGAVVACCMVLGKDSEAVLGHLDNKTIAEVVRGEEYKKLRKAHKEKRFNDISYCKNCDQLYDVQEALVWTNLNKRDYGHSIIVDDLDHRKFAEL